MAVRESHLAKGKKASSVGTALRRRAAVTAPAAAGRAGEGGGGVARAEHRAGGFVGGGECG